MYQPGVRACTYKPGVHVHMYLPGYICTVHIALYLLSVLDNTDNTYELGRSEVYIRTQVRTHQDNVLGGVPKYLLSKLHQRGGINQMTTKTTKCSIPPT